MSGKIEEDEEIAEEAEPTEKQEVTFNTTMNKSLHSCLTFLFLFRKMLISFNRQLFKKERRTVDVIPTAMQAVRSGMYIHKYFFTIID